MQCLSCHRDLSSNDLFGGLCPYCGERNVKTIDPSGFLTEELQRVYSNNRAYYEELAHTKTHHNIFWRAALVFFGVFILQVIWWGGVYYYQEYVSASYPLLKADLLPTVSLEHAAATLPEPAQSYFEEGQKVLTTDPELATELFKRSLAAYAQNIPARNNLGYLAVSRHDWETALGYFTEVLKLDPVNFSALYNLGNIYEHQQDWAQARAYYKQALQIREDADILDRLEKISDK